MFKNSLILWFLPIYVFAMIDPMKPLDYKSSTYHATGEKRGANETNGIIQAIELQGIVLYGDHKIAIINQKVYKEGDDFNAFTVKSIALEEVLFQEKETKKVYSKMLGISLNKISAESRLDRE